MTGDTLLYSILFALFGCGSNSQVAAPTTKNTANTEAYAKQDANAAADINQKNIAAIPLPKGFTRTTVTTDSYGSYLRNLPLKKDNTVYLYNGQPKANQSAQYAVINISVGNRDLQQCADAAMRLRAQYFYDIGQYNKIVFYDNNKTAYRFNAPYTAVNFQKYLYRVFGMCGTASMANVQLKSKATTNLQIGDMFVKGGFPGHLVSVVDVATNTSGEKIFLLAQSYMPAQSIHVLKNPNNATLSPWYKVSEATKTLTTPEWTFGAGSLMGWE
jgi:hypothetical protein